MEYRDSETIFKFGWPLIATRNFEVMQYTGLKDKNGKEIFEGDVAKFTFEYIEDGLEDVRISEVIFEHGAFSLYGDRLSFRGPLQVIGNIYENPELLKASEE